MHNEEENRRAQEEHRHNVTSQVALLSNMHSEDHRLQVPTVLKQMRASLRKCNKLLALQNRHLAIAARVFPTST